MMHRQFLKLISRDVNMTAIRLFTTPSISKVQQDVISERAVKGEKNYAMDAKINALIKVADVRSLYYTQLSAFQDRHFIIMLSRLQQISELSTPSKDAVKRRSIGLLSEKLQQKLLQRVPHLDCEDLLLLTRYLASVKLPSTQNAHRLERIQWVQQVFLAIVDRINEPTLLHEMRLLFTLKEWLQLMTSINIAVGQLIVKPLEEVGHLEKGIQDAYNSLGELFANEIKRQGYLLPGKKDISQKELVQIVDQISRFGSGGEGLAKEVINKLVGQVQSLDEVLKVIHAITRLEGKSEQKMQAALQKLIQQANTHLSKMTYQQLGAYLESLQLSQFNPSQDMSRLFIQELESRQQQLLAGTETNTEKLSVQDMIKIFRSLMHLGCSHDMNQSYPLIRALTNILHKSKEKLTTNQTTDAEFLIRQILLYPVSQGLQTRLTSVHQEMREQTEAKLFKFDAKRLLFFLLQDNSLRDSRKLITTASKEVRGNLAKSLIQNLHQFQKLEELSLVSSFFKSEYMEYSKFIALLLQQLHKTVQYIKEQLAQKKRNQIDLDEELQKVSKLIYMVCLHESRGAFEGMVPAGVIQEREQWAEIEGQVKILKAIGVYDGWSGDTVYDMEVKKFQRLILEDKRIITGSEGNNNEGKRESGYSRIEKVRKHLNEEKGLNYQSNTAITLSAEHILSVDLFCPEQSLALQLLNHTQQPLPHDLRFTPNKTVLEANKLLLIGDQSYTLSKPILQTYEQQQLNVMHQYYLKYFKGITLKLVDHRRLMKEEAYFKSVIQQ